jgi:CheY-like chemotaxis protein
MAAILFVEDNLFQIQEIVYLILEDKPDWEIDFAVNISEALNMLRQYKYNLIVIDIMLPSWKNVPPRDEGLYLAKWIRMGNDAQDYFPEVNILKENRDAEIIFLTSRGRTGVITRLEQMKLDKDLLVINRTLGDAYKHATEIIKLLTPHYKHDK